MLNPFEPRVRPHPAACLWGVAACCGVVLSAALAFGEEKSGAGRNPVTVTLTGDPWPPYVVGELGEEARSGIAVELVREIFAGLPGADVSFPMVPWNRALREVESGVKDGILLLLKTPVRERYMEYTEPLLTAYNLVWYSSLKFPEGFEWETLADLGAYTIGITQGYSYGEEVDLAIESGALSATPVPSVEILFAMLARDRIDFALANDAVGHSLAGKYEQVAEIVPTQKATGMDVFHLAFSRKSAARELIPEINTMISQLRDSGYVEDLVTGRTSSTSP